MLRALVEMIVTLVAVYFARQIIAIIAASFKSGGSANSARGPGSAPPRPPTANSIGELKKDPVCGTFISTATAFQKAVGGETYYFCSTECRDKFKG